METIIYLLKVSACTVVFFALYLLFLRRLTFFKFNRFYLLLTLVASFIIPALNFTIEREVATVVEVNEIPVVTPQETMVSLMQSPITMPAAPIVQQSVNWSSVLFNLYFVVAGCLLALAIWQILQLFRYTKNAAEQINGLKVVAKTGGLTNCSFFNYVFVDNESLTANELAILLKHEAVHAKQLHSIDKLVLAVAKAFLWFNPVVYLYDKALEQNHEYEADEATSLSFGAAQYAHLLLRIAVVKNQIPLVHNFVKTPIKARIKMLFNPKSNHMKKIIYLLALPVGLGLLWGFTVKVVNVATKTNNHKSFTLVIDAGHGGVAKGAEINGFAEKDITLTMANKIKALAEAKGINVVTTRNADENVSIKDRAKADGNILISLHVNSTLANQPSQANGIEIFITKDYGDQVKLAQSKLIAQYLFKGIQNLKGIAVNANPKQVGLALLRESKAPGLVLELGYLTNENDLKFITNANKQNELAQGIVNGVLAYKEGVLIEQEVEKNQKTSLPPQDEPKTKKKELALPNKKNPYYTSPAFLAKAEKANAVLGKALVGVIGTDFEPRKGKLEFKGKYFTVGTETYTIAALGKNKEAIEALQQNDKVIVIVKGASFGGENNQMQITPKTITKNGELVYEAPEPEKYPFAYEANRVRFNDPVLTSVTNIANGKMLKLNQNGYEFLVKVTKTQTDNFQYLNSLKVGDVVRLRFVHEVRQGKYTYLINDWISISKNIKTFGMHNPSLFYKFYDKDGSQKASQVNKSAIKINKAPNQASQKVITPPDSYVVNKSPEVEHPTFSAAYQMLKSMKTANDSLKLYNMGSSLLVLSGKVNLTLDGYSLKAITVTVNKDSYLFTAHVATLITPNGTKVSGDVIEFDLYSKKYKVIKEVGSTYQTD
jgi:N-acetylmuramoyl-L-alanine amidase